MPWRVSRRASTATNSRATRALGEAVGAEVDAAEQVDQEPGRELAVLGELAHVGRLQPRGDVPVDVADVVVMLVLAQVGEVEAGAAHQRAVVALQQAVEAAQHGPLEALEQRLGVRSSSDRAAGSVQPLAMAGVSGASGLSGTGILRHDALDHRVGVDAFGQRLVGEHEAMPQHVADQAGHVLGQGVAAAAHEGERARAFDQADGRARAGAEGQVLGDVGELVALRAARRADQLDRVLHQRRVDVDLAALLLQLGELAHAGDRAQRQPACR